MTIKNFDGKTIICTGTFTKGCGLSVWDRKTDNFYHLCVYEDEEHKPYIEIDEKRYYEKDIYIRPNR